MRLNFASWTQGVAAYRSTIAKKQNRAVLGKISYDWKAAEESLLDDLLRLQDEQDRVTVIGVINELQQAYIDRFIPAFYSYTMIKACLARGDGGKVELEQQLVRVKNGESEYQQIAVQMMLQENIFEQIMQNQSGSEAETKRVQELIQIHLVLVAKINKWQQKNAKLMNYPVFFYWMDRPYLLTLDNQEKDDAGIGQYCKIHRFFQDNQIETQRELIKECRKVIKAQRARQLELILKLPFFAEVRNEKKVIQNISSTVSKLKLRVRMNSKNSTKSKKTEKVGLESLRSEQLQVIKRFRSLRNVNKTERRELVSVGKNNGGGIDTIVQKKISVLKQKVKLRERTSHSREPSKSQIKLTDRTIRILFEKEVDIDQESNKKQKQKIPFLNLPVITPQCSHQKLKEQNNSQLRFASKDKDNNKILKLEMAAQELSVSVIKRQKQIQLKDKNLKLLKLDLMNKVKQKNNVSKKTVLPINFSVVRPKPLYSSRAQTQISTGVIKQRQLKQEEKKELILAKTKIDESVQNTIQELTQKELEKMKNQNRLSEKMQKVSNLEQKLKQTLVYDKLPIDNTKDQISQIKIQKKLQFDYQKQKINEIGVSLEQRVKKEELKYQQLKKKEEDRQRQIKQKYQRQISLVRESMEREALEIKKEIQMQETKKRDYEQKIAREKQENQKMVKEIEEWQIKQQTLLLQLEQYSRNQRQKQEEQQRLRKARLQQQIREMSQKETEIINEYKASNQNLMSMLQIIRQKNLQIQQKIKQHQ